MTRFKRRKTGADLHALKEYNTYDNGKYNAFHDENAPKSVGGTMSKLSNKDSKGNCTWFVFGRIQEVYGTRIPEAKRKGNAGNWAVDTQTPSVGSVVVFTDSQYGHVAFVESIEGNDIILSESAYSERGNDFLFKYGRTVSEVCSVWGMKVKGYINPPTPSTSYDEDLNYVKENGIYTVTEDSQNVRTSPYIKYDNIFRVIQKGQRLTYTHYVDVDGTRWVTDGVVFMARRKLDNSKIYGTAKLIENTKPDTNIGKYANMGGKTWLFKVSRTDETYHGNGNGYNQLTDLRNRSAKILEEDNGRVKISVSDFNPNIVWVAKSQVSITDRPKYEVS